MVIKEEVHTGVGIHMTAGADSVVIKEEVQTGVEIHTVSIRLFFCNSHALTLLVRVKQNGLRYNNPLAPPPVPP